MRAPNEIVWLWTEVLPSLFRAFSRALLILSLATTVTCAQVTINELMSSNGGIIQDENGDTPDWLELYNSGDTEADLTGFGLTDNPSRPYKWVFGETLLPPKSFLLVFASGKDRQPEPPVPVNPATLPGLRLWLDASEINLSDQAQVRRSGDLIFVRRWQDRTSNNNDAAQSAESNQPLFLEAGLNGHPALRFDGANDHLLLPRVLATNDFCIFVVYRTSLNHEIDPEGSGGVGGVSGQHYLFGARHGGDFNAGAGLSVGSNGVSVYEHGSSYMPALAVYQGEMANGPTIVAVNNSARKPTLDLRSIVVRSGATSARVLVTAPVQIGSGDYGAFSGEVSEILFWDRPLSEAERRGVAGYLMNKYGIEAPTPYHTSFELSSEGEELVLTAPNGTVVDRLAFNVVPRDVSYGRQPDGSTTLRYFADPTPGESNSTPGSTEFLSPPIFSHNGGFYPGTVTLTISSANNGAEIRYTLDGSEPTSSSPLYTSPLSLPNRAGTPNGISTIPTVPGGAPPLSEVFKSWVVRAAAFKTGALPSAVTTRTFWIDPRGRSRYNLPVLSLSTHRNNFFDNAIGIYVPGNAANGNYSQRGDDWERPVFVEFYETNNLLAFAQEADVKIHGNTSQNFPIKGLDLDGTGGKGRQPFRYRIFPDRDRAEFEHFLLRPSGHDHHLAFMRDEMMQSLARETGFESQAERACIVFLNGEYWGLHYLKEKEDTEFVSYYSQVPADSLDYLEGYAAPKAGDVAHWQAMISFISTNNIRLPEVYAHVQRQMEIPSYIDYKVCEIFFYRWDIGNHRLWRPRSPEGRWRWLQFDNDVGWGGFWAEQPAWSFNMLSADLTPNGSLHGHNNETTTFLLRNLIQNPDFKRDFINRFADLLNTLFLPGYTTARINEFAALLQPEMAEHTRRWRAPGSLNEWQNNVQYLRNYATNRPIYARQHLMQQFNLSGTARVSVSVSHTNSGAIKLNTLTLAAPENAPWSGIYFKNNAITLTAIPQPGFAFKEWKGGLAGVLTNSVNLLVNGDLSVTAMFEQETPPVIATTETIGTRLKASGSAIANQRYGVESSIDFKTWSEVQTLQTDANGNFTFEVEMNLDASYFRLRLSQ